MLQEKNQWVSSQVMVPPRDKFSNSDPPPPGNIYLETDGPEKCKAKAPVLPKPYRSYI
jgi:hypothetical protein